MKNFTWSETRIRNNEAACAAAIDYMNEHNAEFIYKYASEDSMVLMYFDDENCTLMYGLNNMLNKEYGISTTITRQ